MTRRTWIFDRDLDCLVQVRGPETNHPEDYEHSLHIIRDIDTYKTAASDVATGGQVVIGSRSTHREFLQRNRYVEVGNEAPIQGRETYVDRHRQREDRVNDIRRANGDFGSNRGDR